MHRLYHGVGHNKNDYLLREFEPARVAAMRAIKSAFDPLNIMKPGIILPQ